MSRPKQFCKRWHRYWQPHSTAESLTWTELKADAAAPEPSKRGATVVLVPTVETPQFALNIGVLSGGRRLLSDDQTLAGSAGPVGWTPY